MVAASRVSSRLRLLPLALALAVFAFALAIGPWGVSRARGVPPPTGTWQLDAPSAPHAIEAYASERSVARGDVLRVHASTDPAARYRIEIYRIGWYGGAGGKLVACVPACDSDEQGSSQQLLSPDPSSGELDARWPITDRVTVGPDWQSGLYLGKLVLTSGDEAGKSRGFPFVVRAPADTNAAVLVVMPVNTWQAYNDWGGRSLYTDPDTAVKVSFDRPYAPDDDQVFLDYPIVRFIDQFGYEADYVTDADVDADPGQLVRHRLVVVPAHSEYWTKAMRDGFEAARGLGVNLAFLGGNTVYWQIRYADADRRVLEEYRSASGDPSPNPRQKTVRWRDDPVSSGREATTPPIRARTTTASSLAISTTRGSRAPASRPATPSGAPSVASGTPSHRSARARHRRSPSSSTTRGARRPRRPASIPAPSTRRTRTSCATRRRRERWCWLSARSSSAGRWPARLTAPPSPTGLRARSTHPTSASSASSETPSRR